MSSGKRLENSFWEVSTVGVFCFGHPQMTKNMRKSKNFAHHFPQRVRNNNANPKHPEALSKQQLGGSGPKVTRIPGDHRN